MTPQEWKFAMETAAKYHDAKAAHYTFLGSVRLKGETTADQLRHYAIAETHLQSAYALRNALPMPPLPDDLEGGEARLQRLLNGRDDFIVSRGLWLDFVASLDGLRWVAGGIVSGAQPPTIDSDGAAPPPQDKEPQV